MDIERRVDRSLALPGYAVLVAALVLDIVPGGRAGDFFRFGRDYTQFGKWWSVGLLVLTLAAAAPLALKRDDLPQVVRHPALPAVVAALAIAHAYLMLAVGLIPLLTGVAAAMLAYEAYRTGLAAKTATWLREQAGRVSNKTVAGAGLMAAAVLVGWMPGDPEYVANGFLTVGSDATGLAWGAILLAAAAGTIAAERTTIPYAPWVQVGAALLAATWAFVMFDLAVVPLTMLAAAALLVTDQLDRANETTDGAWSYRHMTEGAGRFVLAGGPLCLVALSMRWATLSSPSYFIGGFRPDGTYGPTSRFIGGTEYGVSGLGLGPPDFSLVPLVVLGVLSLAVLWLWLTTDRAPAWAHLVPLGIVGAIGAWYVLNMASRWGPMLFGAGLALLAVAAVMEALSKVHVTPAGAPVAH